ncbi:hypothetical protein RCL_jg9293.t1 [Rhizophagus clarus]|uniref:Uncharacterized protein n=1 Tax=Rhizophagus clarus TaxID=94130 RepID=A0A8H3MA41_9GLOM|nr:hypothetical protein RCL_jg9293.t1 [Rhizophagus clarus]
MICFIGYGIFLSLINPLMAITQRPGYPLYLLSLTIAVTYLIYKYTWDYDYEVVMDSLILEKIKEVRYFVKKCWNFNSAKLLEKIRQIKSFNFEPIFLILINTLDLFIISTIFLIIIIPYFAIFALLKSIIMLWDLMNEQFKHGRFNLFNNTFLHYIFIILSPLILSLISIVFIFFYTIYHHYRVILLLVYEIKCFYKQNLYKKDDWFRNVMELFLIIIIYQFLNMNIGNNNFIYVVCRINIKLKRCMINEVNCIYDDFESIL